MKATELRAGISKVEAFKGKIETVVGVYPTEDYIEISTETCVGLISDFKPIPLTEEWLVRVGFKEVCEKGNFEMNRDAFSLTHNEGKMWLCFGQFAEQSNAVPCEHVHQLQNLYHALTGEELTIKELVEV
jgi:hypothetical protein